ncbi:hypothetical protein [Actinoalloteichus caeruleus]|uniref:hypothetical protein n=1 Tax=Actinoalloteichus cyanogriseus TaxID=2893586 RepID=UPI003AB08B4F
MMTDPNMVFSMGPRHRLVARSGWEQEEARTVLRDLGWEWAEELHSLVPPADVPEVDAGLRAVAELHLHGHRIGYAVGPYGSMRLTLGRADQVLTKLAARDTTEEAHRGVQQSAPWQRSWYGRDATTEAHLPAESPKGPAI